MKYFNWRKLLPILAVLAAATVLIAMPITGHAVDFGNYAGDNDYGGRGGRDDDWGSGGGGLFHLIFRLIYDLFGWPGVFIAILLFIIWRIIRKNKKGKAEQQKPVQTGAVRTEAASLRRMPEYILLDPHFSEEEFKEKLSNMYVRFQNSWEAKDMSDLRPYLTDAMFAQCDRQLEAYRRNRQTNHIERITVLSVKLSGWKQQSGNDVIVAELNTRIVDYVTDDVTGTLIRGSMSQEKFMTYEWTLVRTSGRVTGASSGLTSQTCPYCGAHIDINHSAKCEYCDAVLTTDSFDWAVSNIKGLSQVTR